MSLNPLAQLQKLFQSHSPFLVGLQCKTIQEAVLWIAFFAKKAARSLEILERPKQEMIDHLALETALLPKESILLLLQPDKNLNFGFCRTLEGGKAPTARSICVVTDAALPCDKLLGTHQALLCNWAKEAPWQRQERYKELLQLLAKEFKRPLPTEVAALIAERTLCDPFAIEQELIKLDLFLDPGQPFSREAAEKLLVGEREFFPWQVAEALLAGNNAQALSLARESVADFLPLLKGMRPTFLRALQLRSMAAQHLSTDQMHSFLPNLRLTLLEKELQRAKRWTLEHLEKAVLLFDDYEQRCKSSSDEHLLDLFLGKLILTLQQR